jgi:hypothetical protein
MINRLQCERIEERLSEFGFSSLEIEKVRQVILKRRERTWLEPSKAKALPFMNTHADISTHGPFYWRNWIVENLYRDHNASWTRLLADGHTKQLERKGKDEK